MAASPGRAGPVERSGRGPFAPGALVNGRDNRSLTSGQEEGMNVDRVGPQRLLVGAASFLHRGAPRRDCFGRDGAHMGRG